MSYSFSQLNSHKKLFVPDISIPLNKLFIHIWIEPIHNQCWINAIAIWIIFKVKWKAVGRPALHFKFYILFRSLSTFICKKESLLERIPIMTLTFWTVKFSDRGYVICKFFYNEMFLLTAVKLSILRGFRWLKWIEKNANWFYFHSNHAMAKNQQNISNNWS